MEFAEECKRYLSYLLTQRGYSQLTIKSYEHTYQEAAKMVDISVDEKGIFMDASPYRLSLISLHKRTIARKIAALRSLVAFLRKEGKAIITKGMESVKISRLLPKPVPTDEIIDVLHTVDDELKVIIGVMYGAGLRVSEVCNLKCRDFSGEWLMVHGKGNSVRQIPLLGWLQEGIAHHANGRMKDDHLFYLDGKRLNQNSLRYNINKIFMKRGIHVTPHQLRHAFATDLLNEGARINDVSELLGHKHLSTTQIYTHVSRSKRLQEYTSAHPMCQKGKL